MREMACYSLPTYGGADKEFIPVQFNIVGATTCETDVPQTSAVEISLSFSFRPIENSKNVTPMSAAFLVYSALQNGRRTPLPESQPSATAQGGV
tara:strand:- start:163 stop:444 length:282 start_codon:yes stop_codon:yes gene_type:complete